MFPGVDAGVWGRLVCHLHLGMEGGTGDGVAGDGAEILGKDGDAGGGGKVLRMEGGRRWGVAAGRGDTGAQGEAGDVSRVQGMRSSWGHQRILEMEKGTGNRAGLPGMEQRCWMWVGGDAGEAASFQAWES